jgi:hypothetical protein
MEFDEKTLILSKSTGSKSKVIISNPLPQPTSASTSPIIWDLAVILTGKLAVNGIEGILVG